MFRILKKYYLHQQFYPDFFSLLINPFFFIRKNLWKHLRPFASELRGNLLDFGCGSKPYRDLFSNAEKYIGVDIENEGHDHSTEDIDVFYDGQHLPFENDTFDSILTSETLEHVPDLNNIMLELKRILKPNGKILITVPFVWAEHELPFDFRRFTVGGIEKILSENGFKIISSCKSGTFFEVVIQLWMAYLRSFLYTKHKYINVIINVVFIFPFCLTGLIISYILPRRKDLYFNTVILAKKQ